MQGTTLGHYRIVSRLGEGGMGVVWLAEDLRMGQKVAVKVIDRSLLGRENVMARFARELQVLVELRGHPHIVTVLDYVEDPFSIVMELLSGNTLEQVLAEARGPLPNPRIIEVGRQILSAVGFAHSRNILHRDLKSGNVFIVRLGSQEAVKVMDFGLAGFLTGSSGLSHTGSRMGTPAYMAPEQHLDIRQVDARSDIYSIGVVLFEMATGRLPFETPAEGSEYAIMRAHVEQPVPSPRGLNPNLTPALDAVILQALAKNKDARFATCEAFLQALDDADRHPDQLPAGVRPPVQATEGVSDSPKAREALKRTVLEDAPPPSPPPPPLPRPPARRNTGLVIGLVVGALVLGGVVAAVGMKNKGGGPAASSKAGEGGGPPGGNVAVAPVAPGTVKREPTPDPRPSPDRVADSGSPIEVEGISFVRVPGASGGRDLYVGRTEVSQDQFQRFVQATGWSYSGNCWVRPFANGGSAAGGWQFPREGGDHPVVCVNRDDAESYARWLSGRAGRRIRLPTSDEWVQAAEGGTGNRYSWGDQWPPPKGAANIADRSALQLKYTPAETRPLAEYDDGWIFSAPVGRTRANAYGLYDLSGNVFEWMGDGCVVRGGSWDNSGSILEVQKKTAIPCTQRFSATGFRLVMEVK